MSKNFTYPEVIDELRDICRKHLDGNATVHELQSVVRRSESSVVAVEEKDIRNLLTDIEGRIELIIFTVESSSQLEENQKISHSLLDWLAFRENSSL